MNNILDTMVFSSKSMLATQKQIDFIVDNVIYLPNDKQKVIQNLDKLGKKEATELIGMLIEIKNEEESNDFDYCTGYDPFFYKD